MQKMRGTVSQASKIESQDNGNNDQTRECQARQNPRPMVTLRGKCRGSVKLLNRRRRLRRNGSGGDLVQRHCFRTFDGWPGISVTQAGQGFDEAWIFRRVVQRVPEAFHSAVNAVLEIDEGILRPKAFPQILPGDNFTLLFEQGSKDFQRLPWQPKPDTVFA